MSDAPSPHRRRVRYSGKNPRGFSQKYKEHAPGLYPETLEKILASGKTPAGAHRPILVAEILEVLRPAPGELAVDCTLGYGGHAAKMLPYLLPGGRLLGLDADPIELPRTEARLRESGFGSEAFTAHRCNFAGLASILAKEARSVADVLLADLGVSSMQLDNPARGFSLKHNGPLDMRMNPNKGQPVSLLLARSSASELEQLLRENSDEPHASALGTALAGKIFGGTLALAQAIRSLLSKRPEEERDLSVRRVFQALRIAANEEFGALETLLKQLPQCLAPQGRVAILTFHSGEDRRVKKSFESGLQEGTYSAVSDGVIRAGEEERRANPRSTSAKLRWAVRASLSTRS
ncbi:MAG: 16S rRNA (cytosine1402-N4)-methyltransferase [Verrucomicrobia bacterium]|nr:MAG: 16S rRNA (cytosine1402-N4)-methyltransferase [Verrucomicrobiota bacterium]